MTLYTAEHLHTAVPHCSHSRAPIVHTAVPRENNEHGCVYLRCRAVCKLPGCCRASPVSEDVGVTVVAIMCVFHAVPVIDLVQTQTQQMSLSGLKRSKTHCKSCGIQRHISGQMTRRTGGHNDDFQSAIPCGLTAGDRGNDRDSSNFLHYSDVTMSTMASQITSLTIVYSTVCSGADQRQHPSSALLAFVRGIHMWPVSEFPA